MVVEGGEHSTIADISIKAQDFEFGRVLSDGFELELERIIPLGTEGLIPLVWLNEGDPETFESKVRGHESSIAVRRLVTIDDQVLYQIEWTTDIDGFLGPLMEHNVYVLEGEYEDDVWEFRLRFVSRDELVEFYEELTANMIPVTLNRLYNPGPPVSSPPMAEKQRETVERAYRRGYFEVPRKTTIQELAEEEGISDSAFSQRLRKSLAAVIEGCLLSEFDSRH